MLLLNNPQEIDMSTLTNFFRNILPVKWAEVEKVPAAIEAEVKKIMDEATAKVAIVKAGHSVSDIEAKLVEELKAAEGFLLRFKELVIADAHAKQEAATAVLPPLALPTITPTPPAPPAA
jgi:hypothetical protein